ncbi:MAG: HD domain-containing phosphohydrolase [Magnetospiraceae bacterium]
MATASQRHADEYRGALSADRKVVLFTDTRRLMEGVAAHQPDLVVADETLPPAGGFRLLQAKRTNSATRSIPFLLVGKGQDVLSTGSIAKEDLRIDRYYTRPFRRVPFNSLVAAMMNAVIEKRWAALPETQAQALKLTVSEYKSIAQAIATGAPIDFAAAQESCAPLVNTVLEGGHASLLEAVRSHNDYTYVHSLRVATLLCLFGYGIGLRGDDLNTLATGGLLHDLGKMVTPLEVLTKPGALEGEEWEVMKNHVTHTGDIMDRDSNIPNGVRVIALQHHEKLDGSGYPKGLKGAEINDLARMSIITDIFGALTDSRPYKIAFSAEKAFTILADMGAKMDQKLLARFMEIVRDS